MKTISTTLVNVIFLIIISCTKKEDQPKPATKPTEAVKKPGSFQFSWLNNVGRASAADTVYDIDLGVIRSSKSYQFLLTNGGDYDITNIQIKSSHPNFEIFPAKINSLKKQAMGFNQLINLDVVHGKAINGSALSTLLPMNDLNSELTITGTTTNAEGAVISLTGVAKFKAFVQFMDVNLLVNNTVVPSDSATKSVSSNLGGLGFIRLYNLRSTNKFELQNTGNVSIKVKYYQLIYPLIKVDSTSILPNNKVAFTFDTLNNRTIIFEFDGANTIVNTNKLQYGDNNKGYFGVAKIPFW